MDLMLVLVTVLFFALTLGLAAYSDWLQGGK